MFVGRDRELGFLERRLGESLAGDGGVVVIEGEAGAGKTALAHTLTRRARDTGVRTAWGGCLEGQGGAPYRPWTQLLRGLGRPGPDVSGGSQTRLFDEVAGIIRAAAEPGLLLVLDDLHWADDSSLSLLHVMAGESADQRLLIVGLTRGPLDGLRQVLRERTCSHLALGGLSPGEVGALAADTLGYDLADGAITGLRERSGGNPLFVLELLKLMSTTGKPDGLPSGVREVIEQRTELLPERPQRALRQVSVLGREFSASVAGAVTGAMPEILDPAAAMGLVVIEDGRTVRFSHALVQEALYAALPPDERRRLHALAARALAGDGAIEAVAYHLREAGEHERALTATLEAARQAAARLAYEAAAGQYRAALELPGVRRAELLIELARCEFRSGAVEEAWQSCRQAANLGRAAGDARVVADAATVLRGIENSPLTRQIHALCRDALAMLGDDDPIRRTRLLAMIAITADPWAASTGSGLGQEALTAAESIGDPDVLLLALQARHTELTNTRFVTERLELGERAVRLGATAPECALWGHCWRMTGHGQLNRRVAFDAELAAFGAAVDRVGEPLWRWRQTLVRASVAIQEGRFEDSRRLRREALAIGRRCRHEGAEYVDLVMSAQVAKYSGDGLAEIEPLVRRFTENAPIFAKGWLALLLAQLGRLDEAAQIWQVLVPHLAEVPPHTQEWLVSAVGNAELLALLDERAGAAELYEIMLPFAGRQVFVAPFFPGEGPVALYLGRLALLLGDPAAAGHLENALAESRAWYARPFEAMAHYELARALRGRREAAAHREQAGRLAGELGMRPLAAQVAALRGPDDGPLSPRERQVAALVAEGLSNRQIATRLRLSERTVENHVSHILDKLGLPNRTMIASRFRD